VRSLTLEPIQSFNLIYGANGSGKSSILEAIHILGIGRSFRSRTASSVINHEADSLSVFGNIEKTTKIPAGIEKSRRGNTKIRIAGSDVTTIAELAELLPIQLINPDSYRLLDAGPKYRRQFMDWGLFHVEQSFYDAWRRLQRTLKQRNAALRDGQEVSVWDPELVEVSEKLHQLRASFMVELLPFVQDVLKELCDLEDLSFNYFPGWDVDRGLEAVLRTAHRRDRELGFTQYGPHRADLQVKSGKLPVHAVLSRGQQKLLVCALSLAQGALVRTLVNKRCIYLIDDLPAELDVAHRRNLVKMLGRLSSQVFVTSVEKEALSSVIKGYDVKMFHVEHGAIQG